MIKVKRFDVTIDIWTMLVQWIQNTLTKNLNKIRGSLENMTRQFMQKDIQKIQNGKYGSRCRHIIQISNSEKFCNDMEKSNRRS
jgi:arginine/ornithine N-succinyltransferase beta subunit